MKIIFEGDNIPHGFFVKIGRFVELNNWVEKTVVVYGADGLKEAIQRTYAPRVDPGEFYKQHSGTTWFTWGFRVFNFYVSCRYRQYGKNIWRCGFIESNK